MSRGRDEVVHREPVWRDRSDFVIAAHIAGADEPATEQLWARQVGAYRFEICCIPFFTYGVALGDVVETADDYTVRRVAERSGRKTFRAWFGESSCPPQALVDELRAVGALLEWSSPNLLAVDAADDEVARRVRAVLQERQGRGQVTYEAGE